MSKRICQLHIGTSSHSEFEQRILGVSRDQGQLSQQDLQYQDELMGAPSETTVIQYKMSVNRSEEIILKLFSYSRWIVKVLKPLPDSIRMKSILLTLPSISCSTHYISKEQTDLNKELMSDKK